VTGGLGAVGRPLVSELCRRGHEVNIADRGHHHSAKYTRCDVGEFRQVEAIFAGRPFDLVYHLAAEFGRWNGEDFYETLWRTNAVGTKNVIRMQERLGFRMVFTSSSEVYGDYRGVMREEVLDETPIRQMNDYAITKWVNEMQIMNSADMCGCSTHMVRASIFRPIAALSAAGSTMLCMASRTWSTRSTGAPVHMSTTRHAPLQMLRRRFALEKFTTLPAHRYTT